jgi:hypothetical protein
MQTAAVSIPSRPRGIRLPAQLCGILDAAQADGNDEMTSLRLAHESGITREVDRAAVRMTETLHHDSRTSLGGHTMKTTAPREDLSQIGAQARTDEMGAIDRVLRLFKSQGNPHAACTRRAAGQLREVVPDHKKENKVMHGGARPKAGRKPARINLGELEKLCALQCTDEEIAALSLIT